ncbi:MAG TPA: ribosome maturation factor RimM [Thermomicrobiaceae bacterium]|nr:ribosome maturation factor RimM [Thermomicrobiaceae bacterium]
MADSSQPSEPSSTTPPGEVRFAIGVVVGSHGVQGGIRMRVWTQFPERIPKLPSIILDDEPELRRLLSARLQKGDAILSVEGITTREMADDLRGTVVRIPPELAAPLEEDEFYHYQIIGLEVFDESGERLGEVAEILVTGANDVYVIRGGPEPELLLPALKDVILEIDPEHGRMIVRPPEYA